MPITVARLFELYGRSQIELVLLREELLKLQRELEAKEVIDG